MAFTAGQALKLSMVELYPINPDYKTMKLTGTYYVWSAAEVNGRIRITTKKAYAGKFPEEHYALGWINVSAIQTTSAGKTAGTASTKATEAASAGNMTVNVSNVAASKVTPSKVLPGQIGYLGLVVFIATEDQIKTVQDFMWTAAAKYASHERHMRSELLEYTGLEAQTITFDITLSAYLGASPMKDYDALRNYMDNGTAIPFKMGTHVYGHYRWVIKSLVFNGKNTDGKGDWTRAKVTVTLMEYDTR